MEKVAYGGWKNCYRLSNGTVDMIATTDVGPRIIRFGFVGEENEFGENIDLSVKTDWGEWHIYGGHRFWHAPEAMPRTYFPDNSAIQATQDRNTLHLIQPVEPTTSIQKEIDVTLSAEGNHVMAVHSLRNRGLWTVQLAPWTPTVMAKNGRAIIPQAPYASHDEVLLPVRPILLWAYTNMSDRRWIWGKKYIVLKQDPNEKAPQKIGAGVKDGWCAYARNGHLFVKLFDYYEGATYPDLGCSFETYTNSDILELETLGPLVDLEPGASVEHTEHWFLFKDVPVTDDEVSIDREVLPRVKEAEKMRLEVRG